MQVARVALRLAQESGDAIAIASAEAVLRDAEASLQREQAEYDEAMQVAEREAAEAAEAIANAEVLSLAHCSLSLLCACVVCVCWGEGGGGGTSPFISLIYHSSQKFNIYRLP